jgi:hypothetical protein
MKTNGGGGGIALPFLTSAVYTSGQLHVPAVLPLGKSPPVPIG